MKRTITNGLALILILLVTSRAEIDPVKRDWFKNNYNLTIEPVDKSFCCTGIWPFTKCKSKPITPGGEISDIYMLDQDDPTVGQQCYQVMRNGNGTFNLALGVPDSQNGLCMGSGVNGVYSKTANASNSEVNFMCAGRCGPGCADTNMFPNKRLNGEPAGGLNRWSTGCFRHDMCTFFTIERHTVLPDSFRKKFPTVVRILETQGKTLTNKACFNDLSYAVFSAFNPFDHSYFYPEPNYYCEAPNGANCAGSTQSDVCDGLFNFVPSNETAISPMGTNYKECVESVEAYEEMIMALHDQYYYMQDMKVPKFRELKKKTKLLKRQCKSYHKGDEGDIMNTLLNEYTM